MTHHIQRLLMGLISGVVATGPMTVVMILLHHRLPPGERYPLPPREITMKLARRAGLENEMDANTRSAATLISHFAYGSLGGIIFSALQRRSSSSHGLVFGLVVWLASYLGWVPPQA